MTAKSPMLLLPVYLENVLILSRYKLNIANETIYLVLNLYVHLKRISTSCENRSLKHVGQSIQEWSK